jgi:hypothetical protein
MMRQTIDLKIKDNSTWQAEGTFAAAKTTRFPQHPPYTRRFGGFIFNFNTRICFCDLISTFQLYLPCTKQQDIHLFHLPQSSSTDLLSN